MHQVYIREDLRRDGLAMNFLVDNLLMKHLAGAFPESRINIGYPAICSKEEEMCELITDSLASENVETATVGHARIDHLIKMAKIANRQLNTSANFWIPFSDYFLARTLRYDTDKLLEHSRNIIKYWRNELSDRPIDVALVDCTAKENLRERLKIFYNELKNTGARFIILCDSRGIGTTKRLINLLVYFRKNNKGIEFHPHNDKGKGKVNIETAVDLGVECIGTSAYGFGERATMIDPRELVAKYNLPYNPDEFELFDNKYKELILSLNEKDKVFTSKVAITGSQHRLFGRKPKRILKFGVTSDKYILSKVSGIEISDISDKLLSDLKDTLYINKKRAYDSQEIKEIINHIKKNETQ